MCFVWFGGLFIEGFLLLFVCIEGGEIGGSLVVGVSWNLWLSIYYFGFWDRWRLLIGLFMLNSM